jgi:ankyrin repeat protein
VLVKHDKSPLEDKAATVRETFRLLDDPNGLKLMFENVAAEPDLLAARDCAGRSLLMKAAQKGSLRLTEALLAAGADPNMRGGNSWTSLHYASIGCKTDVCELLIKWKADVTCKSADGYDPLFYAHRAGDDKVVNCLLSASPDLSLSNSSGIADGTHLKYAVSIGEDGSVEAGGRLHF